MKLINADSAYITLTRLEMKAYDNYLIIGTPSVRNEERGKSIAYKDARDIIADAPTVSTQEIVKPYLEKLKEKMIERDLDGSMIRNAIDAGYHEAIKHMFQEIDLMMQEL